jgi:beta-xylosidase
MTSRTRRATALVVTLLTALLGTLLSTTPTQAVTGGDRFFAGVPYDGEYASPQVLVDDGRYYAYATNVDGKNLPVMHSEDLETWVPREPLPDYRRYSGWQLYNDALPKPARWADTIWRNGKHRYGLWAPAVAEMGGRYVAAYSAIVNWRKMRLCISLAYADHPEGVFTDTSRRPIVCSKDTRGSIDPDLIRVGKRNYLIWKNSGIKRVKPTKIWIRRLNARATAFQPGSRAHRLLTTAQPWEGNVIEAPDMIRYQNRFYLFYSGNTYTTDRYATGYAICKTVHGPCKRARRSPLLATNNVVVGPGGAAPFVDLEGRLRLAYHAWTAGRVGYTKRPAACRDTPEGCPQRRMHIATLTVKRNGKLAVTALR